MANKKKKKKTQPIAKYAGNSVSRCLCAILKITRYADVTMTRLFSILLLCILLPPLYYVKR
jgi:hypothetical protein